MFQESKLFLASPPVGKVLCFLKILTTAFPLNKPRPGPPLSMALEIDSGVGVLRNNSIHLVERILGQTSKHHCTHDVQRFSEACSFDLRSNGHDHDWMDSNLVSGWCYSCSKKKKKNRSLRKCQEHLQAEAFLYSWLVASITTRREIKIDKTTALGI